MDQFQITALNEGLNVAGPKPAGRTRFIFGVVVVVFIVVGVVWFWGRSSDSFTDKNVVLEVEHSKEISSGEKVDFVVKFQNKNTRRLKEVRLVFLYPEEAIVIRDGEPAPFLTEEVKIGEVGPGQEGRYQFPAYLVGDRGEIRTAVARLIFTPEEVRSTFEKEAEAVVNIRRQDMTLTLVAPPNAVSGQAISYILDYRNESSQELSDLKIKFTYPDGFTPAGFNPPTTANKNTWEIKMIKPGEGNRIIIDGVLKGAERESKPVMAVLQRMAEGVAIDYQKSTAATTIATPLLAVETAVNHRSGNYTAQLGEVLNYQVKFTNNSEVDLSGLTITAKLEGSMFDFSTVRTDGFFDSGLRTIVWNASSSPLLNQLAPGQYGVVEFAISLKNGFPSIGLGAKDFIVKAGVRAETFTIPPGFFGEVLTAQTEAVAKIKSLPSFEQVAQYSANGLEGSGPLPPQVGQKTIYTVTWRLGNTAGDIVKTRMRAVLPTGVNWENQVKVSGQQSFPSFKSSSREVVWEVGTLPAGTGSTAPKYEAWFQISVVPNSSQIGTVLPLVKDLILEGEDGATRQALVLRGKELSADDLLDRPNQGMVVE